MLKADGFNKAILGECYDITTSSRRLVYDIDKCINILVQDMGMEHEEAEEYFWFNVHGSYVGKETPIFLDTYSQQDFEDLEYEEALGFLETLNNLQ